VNKPVTKPPPIGSKKPKHKTVEVLNPKQALYQESLRTVSSGAEADSEESETEGGNEEDIVPTDVGKKFAEIKITDLKSSLAFIEAHPDVVSERNQDGIMIFAFNAQMEGKESLAKQYVHQALLVQYVRQVGRSGVRTFFSG
jgi:cell division cycle protein 37